MARVGLRVDRENQDSVVRVAPSQLLRTPYTIYRCGLHCFGLIPCDVKPMARVGLRVDREWYKLGTGVVERSISQGIKPVLGCSLSRERE
jgi:hypothetical protein